MMRTQQDWIEAFTLVNAFWKHSGNAGEPHAELVGGHSDEYFESDKITTDGRLLREAARDLLERYDQAGYDPKNVECLVGPNEELAEQLKKEVSSRTRNCSFFATQKIKVGGESRMILSPFAKGTLNTYWLRVLLCDDVLTTGQSVRKAAEEVKSTHAFVFPHLLTLLNRSGRKEVDGREVISLVELPMTTWIPEKCPLCARGSVAIKPGEKGNWKLLTGRD